MIGQVLGHYRIVERIGAGGMGEVYRASDDRLGREVALKLLKPSLANDPDRLRRFEQEARAAAALNHPNIVAVYDIGFQGDSPYIVSELLHGQTLRQRMLDGAIPVRQANDYAIQIAQGLVAAHEKHIVHRDLKPENLFITSDNRIKILDFGIAKLLPQETSNGDEPVESMTTQTKAGSVLGTAGYMSPEQLRGRAVDHRSDIFSFGSILYEVLTGKRAFSGETEVDTMMAVLKEEPPEMVLTKQGIPFAFEQIIRHCLEKDPDNRFQSARDLVFALGTVANSSTSKQMVVFRPGVLVLKKWLPWVAGASLLLAAAMLIGAMLKPKPEQEYRRLTFERGTIYAARFAPDGRSVLYSASWNGEPLQVYSTVNDSPLSHPIGLESASLLAFSHSSEVAVELGGMHGARLDFANGTLARAPLAGGTPREVLQDVRWADWNPHNELAVVHHAKSRSRLEFPIGNVLYETAGWISHIRFSPDGDKIAFMDHPALWDDRGSVCVIDLKGQMKTLSPGWESAEGLAWSPNGSEVWFTAGEKSATSRSLWAVNLSGRQRKILAIPGGIELQDISADGKVLATLESERLAMEWVDTASPKVRDLSWYDWSIAKDISKDGQWVLFEESSEPAGPNYAVSIRRTDGSPPIRLGDGSVGSLSPDSAWAVSVFSGNPQHITLLPVGPGQPQEIQLPQLAHLQNSTSHFSADGKGILIVGNEPGKPARTYMVDISSGRLKAITPEGVYATLPSPDGKYVSGATASGVVTIYPIDGGAPRPVPQLPSTFVAASWAMDSKSLFVYQPGEVPLKLYRVQIDNGARSLVRELVPANRAGVVTIGPVVANHDASQLAYSYYQTLSVLYEISDLK